MNRKQQLGLALLVVTALVFGPTCANDFVEFDDPMYVTDNPRVLGGLNSGNVGWAFADGAPYSGFWFPLVWLSLQLDATLFGPRTAWGYHFSNVVIHLVNVALFFLTLQRMTGDPWRSAAAAALFAIHPLRVESVAWITERKDVLGMAFLLFTVWAYVRYAEQPGWRRYAVVLLSFTLGLMSKVTVVTLPFALLLLDYWPLYRLRLGQEKPARAVRAAAADWRMLIAEKLPLLLGVVVILLVDFQFLTRLDSVASSSWSERIGMVLSGYLAYLKKTIWPANLAVVYPTNSIWVIYPVLGGLVLCAISVAVFYQRRVRPFLIVGWLWFLGTLVPFSGIIQVGPQAMADRFTYVPHLGLMIMLVWGVSSLTIWNRQSVFLRTALVSLALALLAALSSLQVYCWRDTEVLFRSSLASTRENDFIHFFLGNYYHRRDDLDSALRHYAAACRIQPNSFRHRAYGTALIQAGLYNEARDQLNLALAADQASADNHYVLALALSKLGEWKSALAHLQESLDAEKTTFDERSVLVNKAGVRRLYGDVMLREGKHKQAVEHYERSLRFMPEIAETYEWMGVALGRMGQWPAAAEKQRAALTLRADSSSARANLAHAYVKLGDAKSAEKEYQTLLGLEPDWPERSSAQAQELATNPQQIDLALAVELAEQVLEATNRKSGRDFTEARNIANRVLSIAKSRISP